jgi:hypothetical protein
MRTECLAMVGDVLVVVVVVVVVVKLDVGRDRR